MQTFVPIYYRKISRIAGSLRGYSWDTRNDIVGTRERGGGGTQGFVLKSGTCGAQGADGKAGGAS